MKKIIFLLFLFLLPAATAFSGQSANYKVKFATVGAGLAEGESANYQVRLNMLFQPVGEFSGMTKKLYLGPYYLTSDFDGDGYLAMFDCNDHNPNIYPGRNEVCFNRVDDNCNGKIDEGCKPKQIMPIPIVYDPCQNPNSKECMMRMI